MAILRFGHLGFRAFSESRVASYSLQNRNPKSRKQEKNCQFCQGRILAVWILAPKLPNSGLKIAVDFWVDFILLFSPRKKAPKNPPKNPRQNSPGNSVRKIPLGFLQKPSLKQNWPKIGQLEEIPNIELSELFCPR